MNNPDPAAVLRLLLPILSEWYEADRAKQPKRKVEAEIALRSLMETVRK